MEDFTQTRKHSYPDQFDIDMENAFSKISIIPNYPLLKKISQPDMPSRYETIGILDGGMNMVENHASQQVENYFCLRNLSYWKWSDDIPPDVLKCVYYATNKDFATLLPIEKYIWVSGYFLPSGLFVVSQIRLASDSDIAAMPIIS